MAEPDYDSMPIQVMTGLEPIRLRPTMYVGNLEDPALSVRLLMQALCHAADCAIDGTCRRISVVAAGTVATVSYDAGLPLEVHPRLGDIVALLFLTMHCGCRNLKKHIEVGDDLCDLGLATLTALAEDLRVETRSHGKTAIYHFARGLELEPSQIVEAVGDDITTMTVQLDASLLGRNVVFDLDQLDAALERLRSRIPRLEVSLTR